MTYKLKPYKLKTINTSRYIVCFGNISSQGLQYALIEANVKDVKAYNEESNFSTLLLDSIKVLPNDFSASSFPKMLADAIEEVMIERFKTYQHLFHVSYVGVALKDNKVYVCTAGNGRVHLIENDKITAMTRDHNLIDDPIEGFEPNLDPRIRIGDKYIETRQIVARRGEGKRPVECFVWEANSNFTILVCSYSFHRFREPEEYLQNFLQMVDDGHIHDEGVGGGVITKIEYFVD